MKIHYAILMCCALVACKTSVTHPSKIDTQQHKRFSLKKDTYNFHLSETCEKELYISNHDQTNPKKVALYLENAHNVVIDGNGSDFVFHGTILPIVLNHCTNVTLKNFSIDFAIPHMRQLHITEVDSLNNTIVGKLFPEGNYKVKDGKLLFYGEDYEDVLVSGIFFAPNKRLTYQQVELPFEPTNVKELAPNVLQIEGMGAKPYLKKDERLVLRNYLRPTPAIFITDSKNIKLENVKVHNAYGMGLLAQLTENISLKGFEVAIKQGSERFFTTQADATHFSGCSGTIRSEKGLYEGMADDAINVHGTYLKVIERLSNHSITARYMHPQSWGFSWGKAGDEVQFIAAETMETIGDKTYRIEAIKATDSASDKGAKTFEIHFSEKIPDEISGQLNCGIENLTLTPKVIFSHNIIRNNRARGALFSTPKKVICSHNLFDHTHGAAILLCGDCNGWYETGACRDVTIAHNRFVNALTANYQFTNAIISIYPEIPNLEQQKKYFHSNIRIKNNIFKTFDEPILYAKSVENVIYKNNTIIKNHDFKPFHWNKDRFKIERGKNVMINE